MNRKRSLILAVLLYTTTSIALRAQEVQKGDILGSWIVQDKDAIVQIYQKGSRFEGKIIWLKRPLDSEGNPIRDTNNVSVMLRKNPALGLVILKDFVFSKSKVWEDGTVYDPKNGKTYSCRITAVNKNRLEIRGYIGITLMGRTEIWNRK